MAKPIATFFATTAIVAASFSPAFAESDIVDFHDTKVLSSDDLTWLNLSPNNPNGPRMAVLWGDPMSGPYGALLWVPKNFESPMHTHSFGERIIQISGTSVHWEPGDKPQDAPLLISGDYFQMPGGQPHVSATRDNDSLELIIQDGPFDFEIWEPAN